MSLSVIELLKHIRDEMAFLVEDSSRYTYDSFVNDKKTVLSYTRSFEIIGEACKNISNGFRNQFPHIDWKGFAGLRDIIIHQYFGIDYTIIWATIIEEIPETYKAIIQLIQVLENNQL